MTDEPDTKPGAESLRRRERARTSSHSQIDRVSVLLDAIAAIPGVHLETVARLPLRAEIKAFADISVEQGKRWATVDYEAVRAEKAALQAELDECRARTHALQVAALRYQRGQLEWQELARLLMGAR